MNGEAYAALFADLQPLADTTPGKPDPHENLTDILEIVAVAVGARPAHLQGQGQFDEGRLTTIEGVVQRHGLRSLRTPELRPFRHRRPRYEQAIVDAQNVSSLDAQRQGHAVLWVYRDDAQEQIIPQIVDGQSGVGDILGYPACCVTHKSEGGIAMGEAYVEGIKAAYPKDNVDEIVDLWKRDVTVPVTRDPDADIAEIGASLSRFPYAQFIACPVCVAQADSAAARTNRRMRDLAFDVAPWFGRRIWQARDLVVNRGRPLNVGRNDTCPCGSSTKFKRCCLRVEQP